MKMRDLIFSALVVVAIASSPSFAQIVISNNFDGDDTNDLGGAFVLSSNGLEDNDASVPATGLIQFQDVDTSNPTLGFTSSTAVDLTSFDGFTVEWVVASGVNTADIRSNGWFFGVQDGVGMQGVGDSLWNNVPDAIGVTLFRGGDFSRAEFAESFASDGAGESFASVGTSDAAAAADGFTISLTLNSDNTWSVSSVGLDTGSGELSGSGTLVAADTYASFADNLFASSFFQVNSQADGASGAGGATPGNVGGQYTSVTVTGIQNQGGPCLLGDVNLDGVVDFFDIQPFIDALSMQGFQCEADVDENMMVDFFDIQPFINILAGTP